MWRTLSVCSIVVLCAAHGQSQAPRSGPVCRVDPSWPRVPENWIFGAMAGIATDSKDNVWVIHRSAGVTLKKACCRSALSSCSLIRRVDCYRAGRVPATVTNGHSPTMSTGSLSITGTTSGSPGEVRPGRVKTRSSSSTAAANSSCRSAVAGEGPVAMTPRTSVNPPTWRSTRRPMKCSWQMDTETGESSSLMPIRVCTSGTGGHTGTSLTMPLPERLSNQGPGDPQFNQVHHVRISRDGFVYVADRLNRRIQVFTIDGKFVKEAFVRRASPEAAGTVSSLAFSADQNQQYLYVADQAEDVILVLDRQTFVELGSCGRLGRQAGQFVSPHNIATDSKGNLYVAEDLGGARLQKFVFAGAGQ